MMPALVLWDFGDTLVDERWMRRSPPSCPEWEAAWVDTMSELADAWNVGDVTLDDVVAALARRTGLTVADVEAHAVDCCHRLTFHPHAWRVATERRWPQALVTVNPDLFERHVVEAYDLDVVFDAVVTSCSERTADKVRLCDAALARLGYDGERADVLLVDNRADLVRAWQAAGGAGYVFRSDDDFARDVRGFGA